MIIRDGVNTLEVEATVAGLDGATQWFGIVSTIDCSGRSKTVKIGVRLSGRRI
jgi:hypothetical protein